jgi:hypothetical protein
MKANEGRPRGARAQPDPAQQPTDRPAERLERRLPAGIEDMLDPGWVVGRDEGMAPWSHNPGHLGDRDLRTAQPRQDPEGDNRAEGTVSKRQPMDIGDARRKASRSASIPGQPLRRLDHLRDAVDRRYREPALEQCE